MDEGAAELSIAVMQKGLEASCKFAAQARSRAKELGAGRNGEEQVTANKPSKWTSISLVDTDGNRYAYDANSIAVTNDEKGRVNGGAVSVTVAQGDVSIQGRTFALSFDCIGRYRINNSYPQTLSGEGPVGFVGNVVCGRVRCEVWRREQGKPVCSTTN